MRPSISLKPGTGYTLGDGSYTNPFVIGDAVEEPSGNSFDTVFAANNTDIFSENGLRYEGADPNNYICLDNKTSGTCSDSSLLFRIIGLFDEDTSSDGTNSSGTKKLLKIIDTNNYGGTSGKVWNSAGTNNWSTASLKTALNGTYLTTLLGTSNVNSKLSSAIANAKWHLGGGNNTSSSNYYYRKIKTTGVKNMDFTVFDTKKIDEYAKRAKEQWGQTPEYRQYEEKTKDWTNQEQQDVMKNFMLIFVEFGKMRTEDPASEKVQCEVKKLQNFISEHFYQCSDEVLSGLGQMYANGGEFTQNIDKMGGEGTARFIADAIEVYCKM